MVAEKIAGEDDFYGTIEPVLSILMYWCNIEFGECSSDTRLDSKKEERGKNFGPKIVATI